MYEAWGLGRVGGMEEVGLAMASLSADMLQGLDLDSGVGYLGRVSLPRQFTTACGFGHGTNLNTKTIKN